MKSSLLALAICAGTLTAIAVAPEALASASAQRPEDVFGPRSKPVARPKKARSSVRKASVRKASTVATKPAVSGLTYSVRHSAAIELLLAGDKAAGTRALRELANDESASQVERDQVRLSLGRALYGNGDYTGAIEEYQKIARGSDSWFLALEERGWANLKIDRPEDSLSPLKTLMMPIFSERVASEPYFLMALTHLRVCDYTSVFKTIELFKQRFRSRIAEWESAQDSDPSAKERLAEVSETIQKMSLVEAEAIQRVYMPEEIKGHTGPERKFVRSRDEISFPRGPRDDKEAWLDEVDKVQVSVKGCPKSGAVGSGVAGGSIGKGGRAL